MSTSSVGAAVDEVLQEAVASGKVPHIAAIAADRDGVIYEGGAGPRVAGEAEETVSTSTHFAIMSMTKMVATTAALQQLERGELDLDAPVTEYRPEFANQVLDGFDGDEPRLREPATPVTVRHLITHTSGLGYWFFSADLGRWERATGTPNVVSGDLAALTSPLLHDPGERFTYGINTDWLGRVVEAVAGTTLDEVVREHITGPLGMDDTTFRPEGRTVENCVTVHAKDGSGTWVSQGLVMAQDPEWFAGGHGLYSTPRDYVRFERMLLGGGELDGTRILREQTVDAAFSNQIGALDFPPSIPSGDPAITDDFDAGPGFKWGYGLLLNEGDAPGARKAGTGAWAGLFNTHFFVDRRTGICASIYTNSLPFAVRGEALQVYGDFEAALYGSL